MKRSAKKFISLFLLILCLSLAGAQADTRDAPEALRADADALRNAADGQVEISYSDATGVAGFARVERGGDLLPGVRAATHETRAETFLASHAALFGVRDVASELQKIDSRSDQYGHTRLSYQQMYKGIPVFAGMLRFHLSQDGRLSAVNGAWVPDIDLRTTPSVNRRAAFDTALAVARRQLPSINKEAQLEASDGSLLIYRVNLAKQIPGANHLVRAVEVADGASFREHFFIDAHTGKIVDQMTGIQHLKERRVYESSFDPASPDLPAPAWQEGMIRPAVQPSHEDEVAGAGHAYNLYFNLSGGTHRSWDGLDGRMNTVNNDPTIICPNANWNGTSTNYCTGTSADDVVVHEWTHAYTQATSGLLYQWQSGALNESYSDIFGEVVDLINNRELLDGMHTGGDTSPRSSDQNVCADHMSQGGTTDLSIRWLMGEDAFAFAPLPPVGDAAIRDLWNPACGGDPGHNLSANYHCSTSDVGGVHTNSGIPNRAFALLVDGATLTQDDSGRPYGPFVVPGIGLTKAAHIFWRANSVYNTRATGFAGNADALEQACADLIDVNLTALVSSVELDPGNANDDTVDAVPELSGEIVSASDCASVSAAIAAVQMRESVIAKCGFTPMFDPAPAPRCGTGTEAVYFSEDWENGLPGSWSRGEEGVSKLFLDTEVWQLDANLPTTIDGIPHPGSAMFQENRTDLGNCSTDDEAGHLWLETPEITLPASGPGILVFEHYMASELNFDGGNVTYILNPTGLPTDEFTLLPAAAFTYNAYSGVFTGVTGQNTNPKAGESAWTGGDGAQPVGNWGQSQVDLAALGALPGDTIKIRFDFGQDGCNGNIGWYVDKVELMVCDGVVPPVPTEVCTAFPADIAVPVPVNDGLPAVTTATVAGALSIFDVNFTNFTGTHTYIGDLQVTLSSPGGGSVLLFDGNRCAGEFGIDINLDDEASGPSACSDWTSGGTFRPDNPLSVFDGQDPNGVWTLTVTDGDLQDAGTIDSWSIELCQPDSDGDTVADLADNCTLEPNPSQCDTDGDGFGNHCDADLNNNGVVNFADLGIFKDAFNSSPVDGNWNADADHNCNDTVNFSDLAIMKLQFLGPPGPSGTTAN